MLMHRDDKYRVDCDKPQLEVHNFVGVSYFVKGSHFIQDLFAEVINVSFLNGRNENCIVMSFSLPAFFQVIQPNEDDYTPSKNVHMSQG